MQAAKQAHMPKNPTYIQAQVQIKSQEEPCMLLANTLAGDEWILIYFLNTASCTTRNVIVNWFVLSMQTYPPMWLWEK